MSNGTVAAWPSLGTMRPAWSVPGAGDFNGDGTADILWRNSASGATGIDLMSNGTVSGWSSLGTIAPAWSVLGMGDFTGDGTADILWRNSATGDTGIDLMSNGTVSGWSEPRQHPLRLVRARRRRFHRRRHRRTFCWRNGTTATPASTS